MTSEPEELGEELDGLEVVEAAAEIVSFLESKCKTWHEVVVFDLAAGGPGFDSPIGQVVKQLWKAKHGIEYQ